MMFANKFMALSSNEATMIRFLCEQPSGSRAAPTTLHVAGVALSNSDVQALIDVLTKCLKGVRDEQQDSKA